MEPVSVAWALSIAVSVLTIRRCTATSRSGIFLSSFAAVCRTCLFSVILVTLVVSVQITPDVLDYVLNLLVIRDSNQTTENLAELRRQIDGIDEQLLELLAKRMRISREIGVYKKEHNMPILQSPRYSEILEKRSNMGEQMDLSTEFVKEILKEIVYVCFAKLSIYFLFIFYLPNINF